MALVSRYGKLESGDNSRSIFSKLLNCALLYCFCCHIAPVLAFACQDWNVNNYALMNTNVSFTCDCRC